MFKNNNLLNEIKFLEPLSQKELEKVQGGGRFDDPIYTVICRIYDNNERLARQINARLVSAGVIDSRGVFYCPFP